MGSSPNIVVPEPVMPDPPEVPKEPAPFEEEVAADQRRRQTGNRFRLRIPRVGGGGMNYGD